MNEFKKNFKYIEEQLNNFLNQAISFLPKGIKKKYLFIESTCYVKNSNRIIYETEEGFDYIFFFIEKENEKRNWNPRLKAPVYKQRKYIYSGCIDYQSLKNFSNLAEGGKKTIKLEHLELKPKFIENDSLSEMEEIVFDDSVFELSEIYFHLPDLENVNSSKTKFGNEISLKINLYQKYFSGFVSMRRLSKYKSIPQIPLTEDEINNILNSNTSNLNSSNECQCKSCMDFIFPLIYIKSIYKIQFEKQNRLVDDVINFEISLINAVRHKVKSLFFPISMMQEEIKQEKENYVIEWLNFIDSDIEIKDELLIENGNVILDQRKFEEIMIEIFKQTFFGLMNNDSFFSYEELEQRGVENMNEIIELFSQLYEFKSKKTNLDISENEFQDTLINPNIIPDIEDSIAKNILPPCLHLISTAIKRKKKAHNPLRFAAYLFYDCGYDPEDIKTFYQKNAEHQDFKDVCAMFDESKKKKLPKSSWIRTFFEGNEQEGEILFDEDLYLSVKGYGCKKMINNPLIHTADKSQTYGCPYVDMGKRKELQELGMIPKNENDPIPKERIVFHCKNYLEKTLKNSQKNVPLYSHPNNFSKFVFQKLTIESQK